MDPRETAEGRCLRLLAWDLGFWAPDVPRTCQRWYDHKSLSPDTASPFPGTKYLILWCLSSCPWSHLNERGGFRMDKCKVMSPRGTSLRGCSREWL